MNLKFLGIPAVFTCLNFECCLHLNSEDPELVKSARDILGVDLPEIPPAA